MFAAAVVYFLLLIRSDVMQNGRLVSERMAAEKSLERELELRKDLKIRLNGLKSDPYIERVAREKLGYVRQGETAFKVIGGR